MTKDIVTRSVRERLSRAATATRRGMSGKVAAETIHANTLALNAPSP